MKNIVFICFIIIGISAKCQVKFPIEPNVSIKNDTTFYEANHSTFYSYFKQKFDSIFISFDKVDFNQLAAIDNQSNNGYFLIRYDNQILIKYEIRQGQISGLGMLFHPNLLGKKNDIPYCQAMFSSSKLNGITIFSNDKGIIDEVLLYKKGKYRKHLYHKNAKSNKSLKKGNSKSVNPFLDKEIP